MVSEDDSLTGIIPRGEDNLFRDSENRSFRMNACEVIGSFKEPNVLSVPPVFVGWVKIRKVISLLGLEWSILTSIEVYIWLGLAGLGLGLWLELKFGLGSYYNEIRIRVRVRGRSS